MTTNALAILAELRGQSDTSAKYRAEAINRYHVPGELEIGQHAEVNRTDKGAWIRAYVFIPKAEVKT